MKRKWLITLCLVACLVACDKKKTIVTPNKVTIATKAVDMSAYDGMSSTEHRFVEVELPDVYQFIAKKGSGIFYLGYPSCSSCQEAVKYLNQVADELGVTVYYINIAREDYKVAENQEAYQEVVEKLGPILGKSKGKPTILTPDVFQVIDGVFAENYVGLPNHWKAKHPDEAIVNSLLQAYRSLLQPFAPKEN